MPIYVDPTVSGTGTGTYGDPFKSWGSVVWSADTVFLGKQGTTFSGIINPTSGGTAGARKTIGTYIPSTGAQLVGMHEDMHRIDATGQTRGVYIGTDRRYVDITSLWVDGALENGIEKATGAAVVTEVSDVSVTDCKVTNVRTLGAHAIKIVGTNAVVTGCVIDNIARGGIVIYSDNPIITGNRTTNTAQDDNDTGDAIQLVGAATNYLVAYNVCTQMSRNKQCLNVNDPAASGLVVGNVFTMDSCIEVGSHKCISILSEATNIVRGNTLIGGESVLFLEAPNSIAEKNVMVMSGSAATVALVLKGINSIGRGNTIVGDGVGIGCSHSSTTYTGVTIKNNLIMNFAYGVRLFADGAETYNRYANCGMDVADANFASVALGTGSSSGGPGVAAEYRPFSDSPLLGAGVHIKYETDRDGKMRRNPPTIGAYEFIEPRTERT